MTTKNPKRKRRNWILAVGVALFAMALVALVAANVPSKPAQQHETTHSTTSQDVERDATQTGNTTVARQPTAQNGEHEQDAERQEPEPEPNVVTQLPQEEIPSEDAPSSSELSGLEETVEFVEEEEDGRQAVFVMPEDVEYMPSDVLISVDPAADPRDVEALLAQIPGIAAQSVSAEDVASGYVCVQTEGSTSVEDAINAVRAAHSSVVTGSQPNYVYHVAEDIEADELVTENIELTEEQLDDMDDELAVDEPPAYESTEGNETLVQEDEGNQSDSVAMETQSTQINDALKDELWGLTRLHAYDAWNMATCDGKVSVAVLDNGFNLTHEDLADNIIPGSAYNSYAATTDPYADTTDVSPTNGNHGTHVAGIVGGVANNEKGIAGISYNARIVPIKVFNDKGGASSDSLAKAYSYVIEHHKEYNIKVVNLSVGGPSTTSEDDIVIKKVREALDNNIVTVGAACNSGSNNGVVPYYAYPSDSESIVSVMNIDSSGNLSSTSNYNCEGQGSAKSLKGKNVCAPGSSILSTIANGEYAKDSGTSMACPYVAGVVALEFAADSDLTADAAINVLLNSTHDLGDEGWDEKFGYGEVDAAAAVAMVLGESAAVEVDELGTVTANLQLPSEKYAYDGVAKEPGVEVTLNTTDGTETLVSGADFSVLYENNVNPGLARVVVSGAGAYDGAFSLTLYFSIDRCRLTDEMAQLSATSMTYDARELTPVVTVTLGDNKLTKGEDYTVAYSNNIDVGNAQVTIVGRGNYAGTVVKDFSIEQRSMADTNTITVAPLTGTYEYTGNPFEPSVTVTHTPHRNGEALTGEELAEEDDYTLAYANNVNAGTATVTITGKDNYKGTRDVTFTISPAELMTGDVTLSKTNYSYSGEENRPTVTVAHGGKTLVSGADYEVTYKDNIEVGTASVVVDGKGNYEGTITKNFSIAPYSISSAEVSVPQNLTYTGSALKPNVVVMVDGVELTQGVDYTLVWENNVHAGTAQVTVIGCGSYGDEVEKTFTILPARVTPPTAKSGLVYSGSAQVGVPSGSGYILSGTASATNVGSYSASATLINTKDYVWSDGTTSPKTIAWRIEPASLASATVAAIAKQAYTGKKVCPKPQVTLGEATLKRGTDYTLSYKNNKKAGTATLTVTGAGNYIGTRNATFKIVAPTVLYRTYVQSLGWQGWKKNGKTSGVAKKTKYLEGVRIKLSSLPVSGGITYRTHMQTDGWQGWKKNGKTSGALGKSKRLEAIRIKLTGKLAKKYDVTYRVRVQGLGWTKWVKNGATAGTTGQSKRMLAIQIKLVPKSA